MSSKSSIFLTNQNEHCYDETCESDGDKFRLYLEISNDNITDIYWDKIDGLLIGIKGDSEIANTLRKCRG